MNEVKESINSKMVNDEEHVLATDEYVVPHSSTVPTTMKIKIDGESKVPVLQFGDFPPIINMFSVEQAPEHGSGSGISSISASECANVGTAASGDPSAIASTVPNTCAPPPKKKVIIFE